MSTTLDELGTVIDAFLTELGKGNLPILGAIGAALITAVITASGFIISKDSQVSAFRQAWINALRDELTRFAVLANTLFELSKNDYLMSAPKTQAAREELREVLIRLELRLNPSECRCKKILQHARELETATDCATNYHKSFHNHEAKFRKESQDYLKKEWLRVREGEPFYRFYRWLWSCLIVLLTGIVPALAAGLLFLVYRTTKWLGATIGRYLKESLCWLKYRIAKLNPPRNASHVHKK